MDPSKNQSKLVEFTQFCLDHPELRFWQAMLAWVQELQPNVRAIIKSKEVPIELPPHLKLDDTFYEI